MKINQENERQEKIGNIILFVLLAVLLIICAIPGKAQLVRKERHDLKLNKKVVYFSHKNECVFDSPNGDSLCFTIVADSLSPSFVNIYFIAKYPENEKLNIPFEPLTVMFDNGSVSRFEAQTFYRHNNSVEYAIRFDDLKPLSERAISAVKFQNSGYSVFVTTGYVKKFFELLAKK